MVSKQINRMLLNRELQKVVNMLEKEPKTIEIKKY